jgi:hypothetical protein
MRQHQHSAIAHAGHQTAPAQRAHSHKMQNALFAQVKRDRRHRNLEPSWAHLHGCRKASKQLSSGLLYACQGRHLHNDQQHNRKAITWCGNACTPGPVKFAEPATANCEVKSNLVNTAGARAERTPTLHAQGGPAAHDVAAASTRARINTTVLPSAASARCASCRTGNHVDRTKQ